MKKSVGEEFLSILIPVKNEGINIKIMLKILIAILEVPHEILVIHDSQKDDTIPIVIKMQKLYPQVRLIHNTSGRGATNAIKTGVKASKGNCILIFAADEIGPVLAIEEMLLLIRKGCDLVSCTRYAYGGRRLGGSRIQGLFSRFGNLLFRVVAGGQLTDSTTGIKMFRKEVFSAINVESQTGWEIVLELAIKAQLLGMRLGEVPIISIDRLYGGQSSFKLFPWLKEYSRWVMYGIKNLPRTKRRPVLVEIPKGTTV